jgi:hypothetical protein
MNKPPALLAVIAMLIGILALLATLFWYGLH